MRNYIISFIFATVGITVLIFNKSLSEKLGAFYSRRFALTFGKLAHVLRLDDQSRPFNRFLYRGFVITTGIIFLVFAIAAFGGTNFVGPSVNPVNSLLQVQNQ